MYQFIEGVKVKLTRNTMTSTFGFHFGISDISTYAKKDLLPLSTSKTTISETPFFFHLIRSRKRVLIVDAYINVESYSSVLDETNCFDEELTFTLRRG